MTLMLVDGSNSAAFRAGVLVLFRLSTVKIEEHSTGSVF